MVVSALNRASRSCRFRQAVSGVTRITISGAGRVTSVNVTGDGIDADTARCMANAIKRATFPASGDSLTISLPFNFSP
jgi:DNA-binding protein YbaB